MLAPMVFRPRPQARPAPGYWNANYQNNFYNQPRGWYPPYPPRADIAALRDLAGGDPVEVAVRGSSLVEWRQDDTIAHYKRHLYEQAREEAV